ncbi:MAG: glycosyltransferase family 39 protein [candidate division WOR-3 bacterium]|nr:glycosyltransferase family 39 protein [candidate division WOR-3 bacterium]
MKNIINIEDNGFLIFNGRFSFPYIILWLSPWIITFILILQSKLGRKILISFIKLKGKFFLLFLWFLFFLFTLIPQKMDGKIMIGYLVLASSGFVLLIYGLYPLLKKYQGYLIKIKSIILYQINTKNFLILLSTLFFIISNLISWLVFEHIPHIMDSIAQCFQARIFASGRLYLPAIYDNYFFSFFSIFNDGERWYGIYPFGHSLLLMLGSFLKMEWIINPLLGTLTLIIFYYLGKEIYDEKTGRLTALLSFISPFFLFMSSEYMNHSSALLFLSLFILFYFRTLKSAKIFYPLFAGISLGMGVNIRPLTTLAISFPFIIYSLYLLIKFRSKLLLKFFLIVLFTLLGVGLFFLYNYLTTGNPFISGYKAYYALEFHHTNFGLGFGKRGWDWWGEHTPLRGFIQTGNNLNALNRYLFESPIPGLLLIFLLFITFAQNFSDYLLLSSFLFLPFAYFFYWFQDLCFGPRFLYEALGPILLLSSRGILLFPKFIEKYGDKEIKEKVKNGISIIIFLSFLTTLFVGLPPLVNKYKKSYWGVNNKLYEKIKKRKIKNALIFVNPLFPYDWGMGDTYYGSVFLRNDFTFKGDIVYALDRGKDNYILMKNFPKRKYYFADKDTLHEIDTFAYKEAPQIIALEEISDFLKNISLSQYKYIFLPYKEIGAFLDNKGLPLKSYRSLSYELFFKKGDFDKYLPALAIWLMTDKQKYILLFEFMRDLENYICGNYQFTLLFLSSNQVGAVYEIQKIFPIE